MQQTLCLLIILLAPLFSRASAALGEPPPQRFEITDEMLGSRYPPMELTESATSNRYGYTPEEAIKIGGGFSDGKGRTYSYLNAIRGPDGQKVHYKRLGTCCPFETPNSPFEGQGLLELYEITYEGLDRPRKLHFNWYDSAEPLVPVGLKAIAPHNSTHD